LDNERWCEDCRSANPDYEHVINYGSETLLVPIEISLDFPEEILAKTLSQVGIPDNDVLKVLAIFDADFKTHYITNKIGVLWNLA
jgi:hypothetical protein